VDGSAFFTVRDLTLSVTARRAGVYDGTWGVWVKNAADVLLTRFNMSAINTQDVAVQACQVATVISNGVGRSLSINPLYAGPYGILVSNVDFGAANVPYGLSGSMPKVSSYFTFWNIKVGARRRRGARALSGARAGGACGGVCAHVRRVSPPAVSVCRHLAGTARHALTSGMRPAPQCARRPTRSRPRTSRHPPAGQQAPGHAAGHVRPAHDLDRRPPGTVHRP
jgi:hypothetical protein